MSSYTPPLFDCLEDALFFSFSKIIHQNEATRLIIKEEYKSIPYSFGYRGLDDYKSPVGWLISDSLYHTELEESPSDFPNIRDAVYKSTGLSLKSNLYTSGYLHQLERCHRNTLSLDNSIYPFNSSYKFMIQQLVKRCAIPDIFGTSNYTVL